MARITLALWRSYGSSTTAGTTVGLHLESLYQVSLDTTAVTRWTCRTPGASFETRSRTRSALDNRCDIHRTRGSFAGLHETDTDCCLEVGATLELLLPTTRPITEDFEHRFEKIRATASITSKHGARETEGGSLAEGGGSLAEGRTRIFVGVRVESRLLRCRTVLVVLCSLLFILEYLKWTNGRSNNQCLKLNMA